MKLNHINLPVGDVGATRDFLTTHFGMETVFELGKNALAMVRDEGGMVLILSHFAKDKTAEIPYHKDFHVGFLVDSSDEVDATHARLVANGLDVPAPKRMQGRYGFYLMAPGGFEVEVAWLGSAPRSRPDSAERDEPITTR